MRLRRRFIVFCVCLSTTVAFLATVGWVASYYRTFVVTRDGPIQTQVSLDLGRAALAISHRTDVDPDTPFEQVWSADVYPPMRPRAGSIWARLGFLATRRQLVPGGATTWVVGVPLWLIAAAAAVGPAIWGHCWWRDRRLRRRRDGGLCITCGYDLRGSTDRCPECGVGITQPPVPA